MLERWHEFYVLLGTAAAALVALLFVAASIATGRLSVQRGGPTRTFTSPVLVHYTYVLFVSLVALVPVNTDVSFAVIIGLSAAAGLAYAVLLMVRVLRSSTITDIDDRLGYGAGPPVAYATALAGAVLIGTHSDVGPPLLAAALILLILVNIRNTWDLTVFFAQSRGDENSGGGGSAR